MKYINVFTVTTVMFLSAIQSTAAEQEDIIYSSQSYTIYSDRVKDDAYNAEAHSPDGVKIYSPVKPNYKSTVTVSKVYPGDWFTPVEGISNYPEITTGHNIIDAVYKCALDVLYRCQSGEFIRYPDNGETPGMWQAGFRTGEGYGVWIRDVVQIALLMGTLFDPGTARRSIAYITAKGVDNGQSEEDGDALPAVGAWDYFMATGDSSLIKETYNNLKTRMAKIEYDESIGLGKADYASSIDTDRDVQREANGGYAFSTQIIFSEAYRSMAEMGKIMREKQDLINTWQERSTTIRKNIKDKFWKPSSGYYTEGMLGTKGYNEGYWENLGQSLAMWPRWGIADPDRNASIFENKDIAYNEYGFAVRYYTDAYLGREVWVYTEAGQAIAAARLGRSEEFNSLFWNALRDAAMNKTFMELIKWDTGISERYPGQLWHAMGFISMIYNAMLGMEYTMDGLQFNESLVPEAFKNLHITNFKYRDAIFEIKTNGWGTLQKLLLDGKEVNTIGITLSGNHTITLVMSTDATVLDILRKPDKAAKFLPPTGGKHYLVNGRLVNNKRGPVIQVECNGDRK